MSSLLQKGYPSFLRFLHQCLKFLSWILIGIGSKSEFDKCIFTCKLMLIAIFFLYSGPIAYSLYYLVLLHVSFTLSFEVLD